MKLIDGKQILLQADIDNYEVFNRIYEFFDGTPPLGSPLKTISYLAAKYGVDLNFANSLMDPLFTVNSFEDLFEIRTIRKPILSAIGAESVVDKVFMEGNRGNLNYSESLRMKDHFDFQTLLTPVIDKFQESSTLLVGFNIKEFVDDNYQYYGFTFSRVKLDYVSPIQIIHPINPTNGENYEYFNVLFTNNPDLNEAKIDFLKQEFFKDDDSTLFFVGSPDEMMSLTFILDDKKNAISGDKVDYLYQGKMIKSDFQTIGRYLPKSINQNNISSGEFYMDSIMELLISNMKDNIVLKGDSILYGSNSGDVQIASLNPFSMVNRFHLMQELSSNTLIKSVLATTPEDILVATLNSGITHSLPFKNQRLDSIRKELTGEFFNRNSSFYTKLRNSLDEIGAEDGEE